VYGILGSGGILLIGMFGEIYCMEEMYCGVSILDYGVLGEYGSD
jgi:hypothetical protein